MTHVRHILAVVFLIIGTGTEVAAVLGVVVMRHPLDRLHYVGLASFGALLVGGGVMLRAGLSLIGDKAVLTGALLVLLSPVLIHTTARSMRIRTEGSWRKGIKAVAEREEGL